MYGSSSDGGFANILFGVCGVLILVAGLFQASRPTVFMTSWLFVTLSLFVVVIFAAIDVIRTRRYHLKKIPELRKRMLDGDD